MTKRRYKVLNPLPPMVKRPSLPPIARRCPSGDYEVWQDGAMLRGGFGDFAEANEWIRDNCNG